MSIRSVVQCEGGVVIVIYTAQIQAGPACLHYLVTRELGGR